MGALPADLGEGLPDIGRRFDAPSIFVEEISSQIPIEAWAVNTAVFKLDISAAEAALTGLDHRTGTGSTVLGRNRHRSAQSIHSEQRIRSRYECNVRDGNPGNQVPAHHVAEGLVLPYAVQIHGDTLGRSEQRRGGIATIINVRLEGVPLILIDVHATQTPV